MVSMEMLYVIFSKIVTFFDIRKYFYSSGSSRCYSETDLSLSSSEFSEEIHL